MKFHPTPQISTLQEKLSPSSTLKTQVQPDFPSNNGGATSGLIEAQASTVTHLLMQNSFFFEGWISREPPWGG